MITARPVTAQDAALVGSLVDALLVELSGNPSKLAERQAMAEALLAPGGRVFGFLAMAGAVPAGVIMLSENAAIYAGGCFGVITELFVAPGHRSAGVAPLLLEAAAALGRARGWRQLEVGAPRQPAWARSLQFYLRAGFSEIGPRLRFVL